jgi:hypothetical protein
LACLLACAISGRAVAAASAFTVRQSGPPPGFEHLEESREVIVDIYFGGRKIGEAFATEREGRLRFRSPQDIVAEIPNVKPSSDLLAAFTGDLPANSDLLCAKTNQGNCGSMSPAVASIIYDEDRFRVDLFVNPRYLQTIGQLGTYLPVPDSAPSLTSSFGVALSGSSLGSTLYNLQNRTVLSFRNARVRISSSVASRLGWTADDFVGEVDRRSMRYSAGLFWAPGMDFTGQRRIIGAGFGTQFDTMADRDSLNGTPLVLFLSRPARVEILVEGRLITSAVYDAGNNELDTSALPDGAYTVVLRIHETNGSVREERRFFVKNAQVAPLGRPIIFGYAGVLANTRLKHLLGASRIPFYQLGGAWRVNRSIAFDLGALGNDRKTLLELGGWLMTPRLRLRAAVLASSAGDKGALLQVASEGGGPLNFTFDLRRVWTEHGQALFPLQSFVVSFDTVAPSAPQLGNASYTQLTGSMGYRLGQASVSLVGSYRADRGLHPDYSIGPAVEWPILQRNGVQMILDSSVQRTSSTTAALVGLHFLFNSGRLSVFGSAAAGTQSRSSEEHSEVTRAIGSIAAQYSGGSESGTQFSLEAGADRSIDSSAVRAIGTATNRFGNMRADLLHDLQGRSGTQYGVTLQSAAAASTQAVVVGANELEQSAIIVSVGGDAPDVPFTVLVDERPRGRIRVGQRVSFFLPAYRQYKVRIVPADADPVMFDASTREVTLYPGNVETLRWKAQSYVTVFGQAIRADGGPIANAPVRSARGMSETDSHGYFQIDVTRNDSITVGEGARCKAQLDKLLIRNDYAALGKVLCR